MIKKCFILLTTFVLFSCFLGCNNKENIHEFSSEELSKISGEWKIVQFVGNTREEHIYPVVEGYDISQEEIENYNKKYLNFDLIIEYNKIKDSSPASELGYYYKFNELFDCFRIPSNIDIEEPILYITLVHEDFENSIGIILGSNDKAFVDIDGYFYMLERVK